MTKISRVLKSRDNWKRKAVGRGTELREYRKKIKRVQIRYTKKCAEMKKKLIDLETQNKELHSMIADLESQKIICPDEFMMLQIICLILYIIGIVSFRAVPRILSVLNQLGIIQISRVPHFTSIINWTVRAGIGLLQNVEDVCYPWLALIDCSIDIGTRKALVVLRIPLNVLHQKQGGIGLEDCECIGIKISNEWNGETVKAALKEIFADLMPPAGIIKDNGTDLKKGAALLIEEIDKNQVVVIEDIGHAAANALKDEFADKSWFKKFLEIIRKGGSRIRQTNLANLCPPKLRTKGRFQGITSVAKWAVRILHIIGGQGRVKSDSKEGRLRKAFVGLCGLRPALEKFILTCDIVSDLLKMLKTKGLNLKTYCRGKSLLEKLPQRSRVRIRLLDWMDSHIYIYCRLGLNETGLPVSSDGIESLFGKFKNVIQRCPQSELNRLVYVIPLICGKHQPEQIRNLLCEVSHTDMMKHLEKNVPETLRQMRRRTLEGGQERVPKTGNIPLLKAG